MGPKTSYNTYNKPQDGLGKRKAMTIDEVIDDIGFGWTQIKIGLIASSVWLSDGMEVMVVSILGPTLEYKWNITPGQQALLSTFVFVGYIIGSPIFGYISDKYGRKTSLVCSSMWTFFYGALNAAAPNFIWMVILRMLLGVGIAGGMQSVSFYAEFLPRKIRGRVALATAASWGIGAMLNVAVAMWVIQYSWRSWLLLSSLPGLIFLLFSFFIPESPRFELACGRNEKTIKILESLAAGNGRTLPDVDIIESDINPRGQFNDLFIPQYRKTSILLGGIFCCDGFLYYGIALISTYLIQAGSTCRILEVGEEIWQCSLQSQLLTNSEYHALLWTTSAEFPGLGLSILLIDIIGRKWTPFVNLSIVGVSIASLYICVTGIPLVIILFIARGLTQGSFELIFVYVSEVYPTELRATAAGFGSAMARVGAILTPFFAQVVYNYSVKLCLAVYVIIAFIGVLLHFLLPIETKGREMGNSLK